MFLQSKSNMVGFGITHHILNISPVLLELNRLSYCMRLLIFFIWFTQGCLHLALTCKEKEKPRNDRHLTPSHLDSSSASQSPVRTGKGMRQTQQQGQQAWAWQTGWHQAQPQGKAIKTWDIQVKPQGEQARIPVPVPHLQDFFPHQKAEDREEICHSPWASSTWKMLQELN